MRQQAEAPCPHYSSFDVARHGCDSGSPTAEMWIGIDEFAMPCEGEGANRSSSRGEALRWQKSCGICNVRCLKQPSSLSLTVNSVLDNSGKSHSLRLLV
jgi:hypothetical protein